MSVLCSTLLTYHFVNYVIYRKAWSYVYMYLVTKQQTKWTKRDGGNRKSKSGGGDDAMKRHGNSLNVFIRHYSLYVQQCRQRVFIFYHSFQFSQSSSSHKLAFKNQVKSENIWPVLNFIKLCQCFTAFPTPRFSHYYKHCYRHKYTKHMPSSWKKHKRVLKIVTFL